MKHVHAEVMKALADDNTLPVEVETNSSNGVVWGLLAIERHKIIAWIEANPCRAVRIKPQPKGIVFRAVYAAGGVGWNEESISAVHQSSYGEVIAVLEVRDDGTAHLHKVES